MSNKWIKASESSALFGFCFGIGSFYMKLLSLCNSKFVDGLDIFLWEQCVISYFLLVTTVLAPLYTSYILCCALFWLGIVNNILNDSLRRSKEKPNHFFYIVQLL